MKITWFHCFFPQGKSSGSDLLGLTGFSRREKPVTPGGLGLGLGFGVRVGIRVRVRVGVRVGVSVKVRV